MKCINITQEEREAIIAVCDAALRSTGMNGFLYVQRVLAMLGRSEEKDDSQE
jgi:hypothetical protein